MTKQCCQLPRFAWHLAAFDENFPFHKGSMYYKEFEGGIIYYSFQSWPTNSHTMANDRIKKMNLSLSSHVVRKRINGIIEYHLIIKVKGYYYEGI